VGAIADANRQQQQAGQSQLQQQHRKGYLKKASAVAGLRLFSEQ